MSWRFCGSYAKEGSLYSSTHTVSAEGLKWVATVVPDGDRNFVFNSCRR
jgi:hypothetical protein